MVFIGKRERDRVAELDHKRMQVVWSLLGFTCGSDTQNTNVELAEHSRTNSSFLCIYLSLQFSSPKVTSVIFPLIAMVNHIMCVSDLLHECNSE